MRLEYTYGLRRRATICKAGYGDYVMRSGRAGRLCVRAVGLPPETEGFGGQFHDMLSDG